MCKEYVLKYIVVFKVNLKVMFINDNKEIKDLDW